MNSPRRSKLHCDGVQLRYHPLQGSILHRHPSLVLQQRAADGVQRPDPIQFSLAPPAASNRWQASGAKRNLSVEPGPSVVVGGTLATRVLPWP